MLNKMLTTLIFGSLLVACAKEKDYDKVNKTADLQFSAAHQPKSLLKDMCTQEDPCLYMPGVTNTPYAVTASMPFWQGDAKLVVTNITNDKLQFLQVEKDKNLNDNINNLSPVLNLEVEHVDYKCTEDDYGDCTNKEEVDKDKTWDKRKYVKIKDIEVVETNSLPIQFSELFDAGCFSSTDKRIEKMDITENAINVSVKKTYKAGAGCVPLREMDDLRYLTFTVDYSYSIVKLSTIADKNYPVIDYPSVDESHFGFFTNELKKKTVDNHGHFMGTRQTLLNRWSPNKNEIVYYMNSEFYAPEHASIKQATETAIVKVNQALKKANANIQIKLKKGKDSDIGDLRKNYLIFVKDPQASGIVGYGPSAKNPLTGEILNARTVMYYGTIQKFISRAYDELVDEVEERANKKAAEVAAAAAAEAQAAEVEQGEGANEAGAAEARLMSVLGTQKFSNFVVKKFRTNFKTHRSFLDDLGLSLFTDFKNDHSSILAQKEKEAYADFKANLNKKTNTFQERLAKLAEQTFYHAEYVDFDGAVVAALQAQIDNGQPLERWDALTEEKRKEIMDQLIPMVWVPTLVHEFGHNLGLRHNFYGNMDKDNYYTEEEGKFLGMKRKATFSSIMDYAPRTINELSVFGKYDVAALRFAYAREVENTAGDFVKIDTTIKEMQADQETAQALKRYKYCSDEHVYNNPTCNRHDEGNTYESVVDFYIDQYKKNYEKRNFRGRRYSFDSRSGDLSYMFRLQSTFMSVRHFFETFDAHAYDGQYKGSDWKNNDRLVDIKKAADKSFDFFMDIIEEPAYHCIEVDSESGQITSVKPFTKMAEGTQLAEYGITFDIKYGCLLLNTYGKEGKAYAEFGKYFNNSLDLLYDRSQIYQGDQSQIDVRGMWLDKAMATLFTSIRFTSPTTIGAAASGNYFDYGGTNAKGDGLENYRGRIENILDGLLTNNFTKEVEVTLPNGTTQPLTVGYSFEDNHQVNKSYNYGINYIFRMRDARTNFKSILMGFLKAQLLDDQSSNDVVDSDTLDLFYRFDVDRVSTKIDLARFNYDKVVEFTNDAGRPTFRFGVYEYNTKAMELAQMKNNLELVKMISKSNLEIAIGISLSDELTIERLKAVAALTDQSVQTLKDDLNALKTGDLPNHQGVNQVLAVFSGINVAREFTEEDLAPLNAIFADMAIAEELTEETHSAAMTELDNLMKKRKLSAENISDIEDAVELGSEFLMGYMDESISDQVLLSSFLSLTR